MEKLLHGQNDYIISAADGPRGPKYKEEIIMLNENAVKLPKSGLWDLATCVDGEPNVVPVAFKDVTPEGKLVVGDVFLDNLSGFSRRKAPLAPPLGELAARTG